MAALTGLLYISLEYLVYAAIVFAMAALLFGVMVLILVVQEGAGRLTAGWHKLREHTRVALARSVKPLQPHKAGQSSRA
jgi:hypothetical protein